MTFSEFGWNPYSFSMPRLCRAHFCLFFWTLKNKPPHSAQWVKPHLGFHPTSTSPTPLCPFPNPVFHGCPASLFSSSDLLPSGFPLIPSKCQPFYPVYLLSQLGRILLLCLFVYSCLVPPECKQEAAWDFVCLTEHSIPSSHIWPHTRNTLSMRLNLSELLSMTMFELQKQQF